MQRSKRARVTGYGGVRRVVGAICLLAAADGVTLAQRALPDRFFANDVYPILEQAQCRGCHVEDGVASGTRLHFPPQGATQEQVEAFGIGLNVLVDRESPEKSPLLNKPTNRQQHTGGERIKPGSDEEQTLVHWINHLAELSGEQLAAVVRPSRAPETLPETPLRRLTHTQYNNAVRDLLGDQSRIADRFPPEDYVNGFKNQAVIQGISPMLAEVYSQAAEKLALNAYRLGELERLVPCSSTARDSACRDAFLKSFGQRAFRRPVTEAELEHYRELFDKAASEYGDLLQGVRMVVEAMLQSPKFLFRMEAGRGRQAQAFGRASQLSFFLWNTAPNEVLMRKAATGELDTTEGVEKTARWMLDDPRAQLALEEFFAQWLRYDRALTTLKDGRRYPEFTPELAAVMVEETRRLLNYIVWNDRNFMEAFTADYGFINSELAALYDFPMPRGDFERFSFPKESDRAGILGQATFLASTGKPGETSPTVRGIFVRTQLLCQHVPNPPPGVNATLPEQKLDRPQTNRQRLQVHAENPACVSCHNLMDPIGFGLEGYDTIGRWRNKQVIHFKSRERDEEPRVFELDLDTSGVVAGLANAGSSGPAPFSGAKGLGRLLAESEICQECVVRQLFRYALGRAETPADRTAIRDALTVFRDSGFQLKELLVALAKTPQFLEETGGKTAGRAVTRAHQG